MAARLAANGITLFEAYQSTAQAIEDGRAVTPAAEWLLDNYHLVEKQIRQIRADMPPGYYRQLPKVASGLFAGYPRVFGLAWAFIAHTDSRFDPEMLVRYVRAYQEVQPLTIGELWAISISLRIVLIENLGRLARMTVDSRLARLQADGLADRLLGSGDHAPEAVPIVLKSLEHARLSEAFAAQLVYRLRDQDPRVTPALTWLDQHLGAQDMTADTVVRDVHRAQGAANVSVRNVITSLRRIADVDWTELFEQTSLVDDVLASGSAFNDMDFPTRNLYRSAIEGLARGSGRTELDVARLVVRAASHEPLGEATDSRVVDPGYHLLSGGRRNFAASIGFRSPWRPWPAHVTPNGRIGGYIAAIAVLASSLLVLPLTLLVELGVGRAYLCLLALFGAVPAIDVAVAVVNRAVTRRFGATLLPALALRSGVPAHLRTLVAVPTLLTSLEGVEEQIERLEIHHLASPEGDLHFAILSDWTDHVSEHSVGDQELLDAAAEGIERLNLRYGAAPAGPRFMLLHRPRVWNEGEGRWIGWERKRGKLHDLNHFLRSKPDPAFIAIRGVVPVPPAEIRYVVTLDADTKLPRDAVRRLIGKMAHPLNRPRFDIVKGRVIEGYAVLQPRVTPSLPVGCEGSLYQRVFSSMSGIDPYASAVSDVYQDLFGDGSYAGKGIYDVDAFESALAGRVPDSTLLSHDLFEGTFARAGLVSDVEVVEEFPSRYDIGALRQQRWARGDWQLLPWIVGRGPVPAGALASRAAMPLIGRWKMLDNLRRTLSAPTAIMALMLGWTMAREAALVWTGFVLGTIALPTLIPFAFALRRNPGTTLASHLRALRGDLRMAMTQSLLAVTFLAHQAWLMGDAILRTLGRLFVTRRHLLEWVSAGQAASGRRREMAGFYRLMLGAPVIALAAILASIASGQGGWQPALLLGVIWLVSPAVAYWVSLSPSIAGISPVSLADARALRLVARRTWRFFEVFVTPADNMLPPDNFQEDPAPALAHRTSPTNLGLYLLSVVSARDFGWIGLDDALGRLEATLATMSGMERFLGHFYNWYDTQDLRALEPKYVSSVDSGNLAGHLIALANACREWRTTPADGGASPAGIVDAIDLTRGEAASLRDGRRTQTVTLPQLEDALSKLAISATEASPESISPLQRLRRLAGQAETMIDIARALATERGDDTGADMLYWASASLASIESHARDLSRSADGAITLSERLAAMEDTARAMALAMEFGFLLDRERMLLSIGYLVPEGILDENCYDLLASEARLASFFAIAKGDVPARHWFRLGRAATAVTHSAALISWSGSMFEYLMPSLVMRAPAGSLLEQTSRLIVRRQIDYATELKLPWGISESAYNVRDLELTYQYSNFGVPGLGLKRGLGESRVIAPYATALAAMVDARAAVANLARLQQAGGLGRYGFCEALDYTPGRVPEGKEVAVVRAYMAHHQGMTIVAIADAVLGAAMRTRFHAEPIVQATELLLQERTPRDVAIARPWAAEIRPAALARDVEPSGSRHFASAHQATPATHLLSNGRYTTMLTASGSGYSLWGDIAVTRWREDPTCDDFGSYIFIRDVQSGEVWSAGFQPIGSEPDEYSVAFHEDRAEFTRQDGSLTTILDVLISPEHDAEGRRVSISNAGGRARELEITSYAELVLARSAADISHPAFSKLFVETEYLADIGTLVATRRKRSPSEPDILAAHLAVVEGEAIGKAEIETDRARFLGRGHGVRQPHAVIDGRALSNTVGTVLDPIFALRRRVKIAPGATVRIAFWTLVASTRTALLDNVDKYKDMTAFGRAMTLAWTQAQVQLHHLGITPGEAGLFQRLAGHVIYATPALRPSSAMILQGAGPQSGLWGQGISGDLPIVLLRISDIDHIEVAHQLLQAHEYWRLKQIAVDLVILNERQSSYVQDLQIAIETQLRTSQSRRLGDGPSGRVFILRADLIPGETRMLLTAAARIVIVAQRGSLHDQLDRLTEGKAPAKSLPARISLEKAALPAHVALPEVEFFNGLGGFAADGQEYVTVLGPAQATPAPWINVVANPVFGFHVATEGSGYTWSVNSRENQITPWSNDPVTDRPGEAFYLHDDDTGELWSPTASPIRDETGTYVARHGRGYSRFEHMAHGIETDLVQFVPMDAPVKISRLTVHNRSNRVRHLSVTAYVEWVLAPSRSASQPFVTTEFDPATGAIFAKNPWNMGFGSRVAFLDLGGRQTDGTGDRREFIGHNGSLANPACLTGTAPLSQSVGAGLDPCGALRTRIELPPGSRIEIVAFLGQAEGADEAKRLIARYRNADLDAVRRDVARYWDEVLGKVQVKTPERSMDIMLNGWLLYQSLACRVWARSAFYQASGAYGFRDQLQDGMALATSRPGLTREHLLRAAARQFVEGDVQHWWLPHSGQGVRTRISDDRAWLAFTVHHYVVACGDLSVLDELVPFLEGQMLREDEHDNFFHPTVSDQTATLFEHCALALDNSLALGVHGLPLMGTGDWNDGMNRVGEGGQGESVWLGWLLVSTLHAFAVLADGRSESRRADAWRTHAATLQVSLEREGWDGDWYRRGFFDDGTPFGSAASEECRIDSIAQSWAVLSGVAEPGRAAQAMAAVRRDLILTQDRLALLFTPPFDKTPHDPGYIKGYPPGIRENGGQYTHAAQWSVMAFAALGEGSRAVELFSLLNPINHARTRTDVHRYKVEPYVLAADIYSVAPHVGRGGWTWYTGSAGWMQRAGIESILGLRLAGDILFLDPCIPTHWDRFEIILRHGSSRYEILVENPDRVERGVAAAEIDGRPIMERPFRLMLVDDGAIHRLTVRLGL